MNNGKEKAPSEQFEIYIERDAFDPLPMFVIWSVHDHVPCSERDMAAAIRAKAKTRPTRWIWRELSSGAESRVSFPESLQRWKQTWAEERGVGEQPDPWTSSHVQPRLGERIIIEIILL